MGLIDEDFGVKCLVANKPVYLDRALLREHAAGQSLPLSERIGERLMCIPIHPAMSDSDNEYICASVIESIERMR